MKRLSMVLALVMALAMLVPMSASAEAMTDVGTPRAQTLIVEPDGGAAANPGQFNPYMSGTSSSFGTHQLMWAEGLWDTNTMTGETIPTYADGLAEANEDFTEWTIKIKKDLKWSDGETFDANDVYFTFDKIMTTPDMSNNVYYNTLFEKWELVDDYTIKLYCKAPFPRLMTTLGVNTWGCSFRILPEHQYKDVEDILTFTDSEPLSADCYKVARYDSLGTWILYEVNPYWANTPTGMMYGEPKVPYVLYRVFGSAEARVMAAINGEVDVMNEVSYENLQLIMDGNENFRAWYSDFPYANTDDACSKGIWFNCGIEPLNNTDVRWALTICCDWIEVTENIFEGIGRMSALNAPSVTAIHNIYYKTMEEWLTNEFMVFDGTYNPWNPNFELELRDALVEDFGYALEDKTEEELTDMFGIGYFKTDKEKAAEVLQGIEGFELKDGKWFYKGEPWKITVLVHDEESSTQASRSGKAIADQWAKFGLEIEVTTVADSDIGTRGNQGDFMAADYWSTCSGYRQDFYGNISGWNFDNYSFGLDEVSTGGMGSYRMHLSEPEICDEITALVNKIATVDPNSTECYELHVEFLKKALTIHPNIDVHAGTKIVPFSTQYFTGFPTAENPYEGPWWWWSLCRFIYAQVEPVAAE